MYHNIDIVQVDYYALIFWIFYRRRIVVNHHVNRQCVLYSKNFSFLFCSRRVIAMSCHSIDYMYVYICTEFSKAQIAFASALGNFSFQTIGEQTEDEKLISKF